MGKVEQFAEEAEKRSPGRSRGSAANDRLL